MVKRKRAKAEDEERKRLKRYQQLGFSTGTGITIKEGALQNVYSSVQSLRNYFLQKLPSSSRRRRKRIASFDENWPEHSGFLDRTLVGVLKDLPDEGRGRRQNDLRAFTQTQRSATRTTLAGSQCNTEEVLDFVIWQLFQRNQQNSRRPDHLLCHGFDRTVSVPSERDQGQNAILPGIFRQWLNPNVEAFKKSPWTEAFSLLGGDFEMVFCDLLFDCGIFLQLKSGKGNMFQMSGQPIFNVGKPAHEHILGARYHAKNDPAPLSKQQTAQPTTPGQITFVRNRMFYARASVNQEGSVKLGLRHLHVLNRYDRLATRLQQLRLLQYVFPRQFGLHNVFTSLVDTSETAQPWKDYTVRDEEINQYEERLANKVPRRLRGRVNQLICKLKSNHRRCSYVQLLRHYTTQSPRRITHLQGPFGSEITTIGAESHQDEDLTAAKSSFLAYATPYSCVSAFCRSVLRTLIPYEAFGTGVDAVKNWTHFLRMVDRFVSSRRFESFTLHEVVHALKLASLDWLRPDKVKAGQKLTLSDRRKRCELLQEFVYFLFDAVLIPLVRSNFYVTETSLHRNRLYYFRHDVWRKISEPSLMTLRSKMFEPLNARQLRHALQSNRLGHSQVRLLPKEHGARPITNLRRRAMISLNGKRVLGTSINTKLAPAFSVLNFERERQPDKIASALFSVGEIGQRLKKFSSGPKATRGHPQLFFVKMDIKSCFDTIPQEQLLDLVRVIVQENEYRLTKYVETKRLAHGGKDGKPRLSSRFVSRATGLHLSPGLSAPDAERFCGRKKGILVSSTDQNRIARSQQILQLLKDHIQDNIVRIGRRHFRQIEGIPQGSVLSSLLCSFFYAKFEQDKLGFLDPQSSILLRLIDDFLLITEDKSQAHSFVKAMSDGFAEYGISINAEKSMVNFEVSVNGQKIPRVYGTEYFPYCGLGVHMKTLELRKDRCGKAMHVKNALTVDISGRAVTSLQRRILTALKLQMHAMLLDATHNSLMQITTTLFECYIESTMKLHQYRINMPRSKRPGPNFMIALCQQMLYVGHKLFIGLPTNDRACIQDISVFWTGSVAMIEVLSRKQTEYGKVLEWLHNTEQQVRHTKQRSMKGLEDVARAGMAPFRNYIY